MESHNNLSNLFMFQYTLNEKLKPHFENVSNSKTALISLVRSCIGGGCMGGFLGIQKWKF